MINSKHAWSLGTVKAGQWMQIDMGEVLTVAGTIVQNRKDYPGQHVKTYTVKTSLDGKNFEAVSGGAYEGKKGTAKNLFHSGGKRKARYVRFTVQTWDAKQHPSMRADVLVVEKKGPSAGISTRAIAATGGGVTCGDCPAGYTNDGAKGCKKRVDPCATNNGGCNSKRKCTVSGGSVTCGDCPAGFPNDGAKGCKGADPCATNNGGCDGKRKCTVVSSEAKGGYYTLFHDGHCASGWLGGNTCQKTLEDCAEKCRRTAACGYFAHQKSCTKKTAGTNCAMYSVAGKCKDDNNYPKYNAYRITNREKVVSTEVTCGDCPAGYANDGAKGCKEADPCATNNGGCASGRKCTVVQSYSFFHDGHCASGWIGGNTCQKTLGDCAEHCRLNPKCGYFAHQKSCTEKTLRTNCAMYTAAGKCKDDNNYPKYNAYRITNRVSSDGVTCGDCPAGQINDGAKGCKQKLYEFFHDGHCASGWLGGVSNSCQPTLEACAEKCRLNPKCGYFAHRKSCGGGTNCAMYSVAGKCKDDNAHPDYNAYRIISRT